MTNPFLNIELSKPSISPINFHDIKVSEFLVYFYRQLKSTVEEEGFQAIIENNKTFFNNLDKHVYTITRTDNKNHHSIRNHEFVEAIDMLKPLAFLALKDKIQKKELNLNIAKKYYSVNLANYNTCKEHQSNCFLSQF